MVNVLKSEKSPRRSHKTINRSSTTTKRMAIAETNVSLQLQTHQPNPTLKSLFHALDPISLILNHNSVSLSHHPLLPLSHSFIMDMERGPRYEAYAGLRETKLRMKYLRQQQKEKEEEEEEHEEVEPKLPTPPRKQVKFQAGLASGRKGSSVLAQSVPDFSVALRKENRKPLNMLPSVMELTPPSKSFSKGSGSGVLCNSRGSVSASAGEKRKGGGGVLMARKSYASIDELKSFSKATANAINGESRGAGAGRNGRVMRKTVLGYRQF